MTRPFEGIRVIDMTHVLAGPFSTYQLGLLGAEVVKVETPEVGEMMRSAGADRALRDERMGTLFLNQNANKRSLTLNLKAEQGREVLKRLVANSDVLVENYRAGAMADLGLGYEDMTAINPRLIYCSMSGFGQEGPKGRHTAYDNIIQAASGVMDLTGTAAATPLKVGAPLIDYGTGTTAAFAMASALFQRERTGVGQQIDCSMLDTMVVFMGNHVVNYLYDGTLPKLTGNDDEHLASNSCYETADGLLMLGAYTAGQNRRMWVALDRPDLAEISDADTRAEKRDMLAAELGKILATRTAEAWEDFFNDLALPAARVATLPEGLAREQLKHRAVLHRFDDLPWAENSVTVPVAGFQYHHDGPRVTAPPPRLGADTDAILTDLAFEPDEIAAMHRDGVV